MAPTSFETSAHETRAKRLSILIDASADGVKLVSPTQREAP